MFVIGFRINRFWSLRSWLPVFFAMPGMLRELGSKPASGLLGARTLLGGRGATVIQHWTSIDDLYAYANDPQQLHRPAWKKFNQRVKSHPGAVGIWHETYRVPAENAETMYVQMPPIGLGAALGTQPVERGMHTARERLNAPVDRSIESSRP